MKSIVELFRDNIAFKIIAGILLFIFTNVVSFGNEAHSDQLGKEITEITFDKKFLEISSIYNDHYLTY